MKIFSRDFLSIVTIALWSSLAMSAELKGHIYDHSTGVPVSNAKIRVLGSQTFALSEDSNGYFILSDIPAAALVNNQVEVLVTKDGYYPETTFIALSERRASISVRPQATIVDVWIKRLKDGDRSCDSNTKMVQVIGNLYHEYPNLKVAVTDALLQIFAKYGFAYSTAESRTAEICLGLLREGKRCDDANKIADGIRQAELDDKSDKLDDNDPISRKTKMQFLAVALILDCKRGSDKEFNQMLAETVFKALAASAVTIRVVRAGSIAEKGGLLVGDVITSYAGKTVESPENLQALIDENKNSGSVVVIEFLRNGSDKVIEVAAGDLGVIVNPAKSADFASERLKSESPPNPIPRRK